MRNKKSLSANFIRLSVCATLICHAIPYAHGVAQTMPEGPFSIENLLSALEYGRLHTDKRMPPSWYIERIKKEGVNFHLSLDDEKRIRQHGDYLGEKGLDELITAIKSNYRSEAQPSSWQLSGKILDGRMPIALNLGGGYISGITTEALRSGINLGDFINRTFNLGGKINLPVKLYEENNRLMVDAELYNEKQELVCSIVRSEWQFNPDGRYDRNYNNNAFEIVDGNLMPMLQIYLKESNKIYIGGFFRTDKGGSIGLTPKGTLLNPLKLVGQVKEPLRLFKYPSRENPGKLEVGNLPNFDRYDDEMALAQQIESNKLKYSQLTNEEIKLKVAAFISELTQLDQTYRSQDERLENEHRKEMSTEAYKQMNAAAMAARSPEERGKALRPLREFNERFYEKRSQIEEPIVETYKQKLRLDAVLLRDEMLRRIHQVPARRFAVAGLKIFYAGYYGVYGIRNVIEHLQLLAANLP